MHWNLASNVFIRGKSEKPIPLLFKATELLSHASLLLFPRKVVCLRSQSPTLDNGQYARSHARWILTIIAFLAACQNPVLALVTKSNSTDDVVSAVFAILSALLGGVSEVAAFHFRPAVGAASRRAPKVLAWIAAVVTFLATSQNPVIALVTKSNSTKDVAGAAFAILSAFLTSVVVVKAFYYNPAEVPAVGQAQLPGGTGW